MVALVCQVIDLFFFRFDGVGPEAWLKIEIWEQRDFSLWCNHDNVVGGSILNESIV